MTQAQLNRAVSQATGDDCEVIARHGFSLVEDESPVQEDDLLALITDWQQLDADREAATQSQSQFTSVA